MRISVFVTLVTLGLGLAPAPALAGGACDGFDVVGHIFEMSDTDRSGSLSPAEFEKAGLERYGVSFGAYDTNGDGEASLDEYYDVYDRHHPPADAIES